MLSGRQGRLGAEVSSLGGGPSLEVRPPKTGSNELVNSSAQRTKLNGGDGGRFTLVAAGRRREMGVYRGRSATDWSILLSSCTALLRVVSHLPSCRCIRPRIMYLRYITRELHHRSRRGFLHDRSASRHRSSALTTGKTDASGKGKAC